MTPIELATVWVPVPLRWRHILPGDVFVGRDDRLWLVAEIAPRGGCMAVIAQSGADSFPGDVDPDDVIPVLVPTPERDAVEMAIDQLGARLVERRTAPLAT